MFNKSSKSLKYCQIFTKKDTMIYNIFRREKCGNKVWIPRVENRDIPEPLLGLICPSALSWVCWDILSKGSANSLQRPLCTASRDTVNDKIVKNWGSLHTRNTHRSNYVYQMGAYFKQLINFWTDFVIIYLVQHNKKFSFGMIKYTSQDFALSFAHSDMLWLTEVSLTLVGCSFSFCQLCSLQASPTKKIPSLAEGKKMRVNSNLLEQESSPTFL